MISVQAYLILLRAQCFRKNMAPFKQKPIKQKLERTAICIYGWIIHYQMSHHESTKYVASKYGTMNVLNLIQ